MTDFAARGQLAQASDRAIERVGSDIKAICREIFENPEPAFSEAQAARLLTEFLASVGYEIQMGLADMPTAFQATARNFDSEAMRKGLRHGHVAVLAEYDADPEGHRSGRQLVAGGALAAAVGLGETLHGVNGQVMIIGCPAATTLEGKRRLAAAGIFEAADAALGSAPASTVLGYQPIINSSGNTLAGAVLTVRFDGEADDSKEQLLAAVESFSHDLDEPDSITVSSAPSGVDLTIRSTSNPRLEEMVATLTESAERVAAETETIVHVDLHEQAPAFNVNRILARRIKTFTDTLSLHQNPVVKAPPAAPTDWGHVSLVTATAQAMYPISESDVERGTQAFADASVSEFACLQMLTCSKAVARAGLDLLGDMEFRGYAEGELIRSTKAQGRTRVPRRWLGVHPVQPRELSNGHDPAKGSALSSRGKRS